MPPCWQMKTSMAGRENNEVVKKKQKKQKPQNGRVMVRDHGSRHLSDVIPLAGWAGGGEVPPDEGKA